MYINVFVGKLSLHIPFCDGIDHIFPGPIMFMRMLHFIPTAMFLDSIRLMTSPNGNIFRVAGHLCGEFTGYQWIPHTKVSDAELWCFLWSEPE